MAQRQFDVGIIGLGVMGSNFTLNIAEHGFSVVGYDSDAEKGEALRKVAPGERVQVAGSPAALLAALTVPRKVILLVPAGKPVDMVINRLLSRLVPGDIIIDAGNSHFTATDLRQAALAKHQVILLGVGISGGAEGARRGPCIMPGGSREAYERICPIFEAAAAHVDGDPCVTYLGPGSAGHYVKMVHNGIEYALMQLISETYDLMKRGMGMSDNELHQVYAEWNHGELRSYLLEITADIFTQTDPQTGERLIDVILGEAAQSGTGIWTSQDAMERYVPTPLIDTAVAMRALSTEEAFRQQACPLLTGPSRTYEGASHASLTQLRNALYLGMILAFAQGMALLQAASRTYHYDLDLAAIARIWRGGCIIRAALLERLRAAFQAQPESRQPAAGAGNRAGTLAARKRSPPRGVDRRRPGPARRRLYVRALLLRCLPQRLAARQPDSGPARLFRRPHLRTRG